MPDSRFHTLTSPKTLKELAEISGADLNGSPEDFLIEDVAPLDQAAEKQISFLDNVKYKEEFQNTKASACIISPEMAEHAPDTCHVLISKTPYKAYALIAQAFYPAPYPKACISDLSDVHQTAKVGKGCVIESGVVIGEGAVISDGCWIEANAVIGQNVTIGKNSV